MARTEQTDRICIDCWERAVDSFGTGEVFQKRSGRYTTRIQWLSFSGLVLPRRGDWLRSQGPLTGATSRRRRPFWASPNSS
jgi:hypothetical protein